MMFPDRIGEMPRTSPKGNRPLSWIHVNSPSKGAETSRILKKKHHEKQLEAIRQLERKIKEKKRANEKLAQKVLDRKKALEFQNELTDRIKKFESKQIETS